MSLIPASFRRWDAAWVVLLFLAFSAITFPQNSATAIYRWPGPMILMTIGLGVLAFSGFNWFQRGKKVFIRPAFSAGLVMFLTGGLLALILSSNFFHGLPTLLSFGLAVSLVFAIAVEINRSERTIHSISLGVGIFGACIALLSLYRWIMGDIPMALGLMDPLNATAGEEVLEFKWHEHRNAHPFGHQNYTAGMMLLVLPWHIWLFFRSERRMKLVWGTAVLADLICIYSTFSRGAWGGLGVGVMAMMIWFWKDRIISRKRLGQLLSGLFIVLVAFVALNPRLIDSFRNLASRGTTGVDQIRESMLEAGLKIASDHWLTGIGPGNTTLAYREYRSQLDAGLEDNYQLHNTPVQLLAEFGVLGLLGVLLIAGASVKVFMKCRQNLGSPVIPALFSLLVYGGFSITDYQLDVPAILFLLSLNAAVLAGTRETGKNPSSWFGIAHWTFGGVTLITVVLWGGALFEVRARGQFNQAMELLNAGKTDQFVEFALRASETSRHSTYYLNQLAAYHGENWLMATNPALKELEGNKAMGFFQRSLAEDPIQEFCHFNLGWLQLDKAPLKSAAHFIESARLVPDRKGVYRGLGESLLNAGLTDPAVDAFVLECLVHPDLGTSAFWKDRGLEAYWPEVRDRLIRFYRDQEHAFDPPFKLRMERRKVFNLWYYTGAIDHAYFNEPRSWLSEFETTIRDSESPVELDRKPMMPWKFLYRAWKDPTNRSAEIDKAMILDRELPPVDAISSEIEKWLAQNDWPDVIRRIPPSELHDAYRRQRSGFNLLARNMDGRKPTDLCIYLDNYLVANYFEFVSGYSYDLPSSYVLERLEQIAEQLPL